PGLANSDAHILDEIGSAYNLIETSELNISSVLEAIRKNMVKPFFGNPSLKTRLNRLLWSVESSTRKITKK
ncbi:MAG: PHP-associated domain-containing protein, partial [Desulfurococcaceae archaeon]